MALLPFLLLSLLPSMLRIMELELSKGNLVGQEGKPSLLPGLLLVMVLLVDKQLRSYCFKRLCF